MNVLLQLLLDLRQRWRRRLCPGILTWIVALPALGNWPQFRGPEASGVDVSRPLPTDWDLPSGKNVSWRSVLPGLGHAAPIVWGNTVYLATAVRPGDADLKVGLYGDIESANDQAPHEWRLLALDLDTGTTRWDIVAHSGVPRVKRHTKASHCNSTPATDGSHIVAILGSEGLFCFDEQGRKRWQVDLGPMDSGYFAVPAAQWGFGSSPVIHRDQVLVQCDVQTNSYLASFRLKDGRKVWQTERRDVPSWGSPTVVTAGGTAQIVVNGWHHIGGYRWEDGSELWRLDGGGDIPVPTPILAQGLIIQTSAHGRFRPFRAIRPSARGDITPSDPGATNATIAWAHPRLGNYMQTPIAIGGLVWGCFDNGVLTCFDATSGTVKYSERLPSGQGYTGSPVSDGRHLFFTSETGQIYAVPAQDTFSIVSTNVLGETVMATPAIGRGHLLFRTRHHLVALASTPPSR
ncbi:MAG: PQQ-binding-like beta-propeller repeat protein [Verrucomicrobiales bacterium]|nr:PQQ-binding-like beta-propeller repeat protein [Verrucomicrobiales bacterium]